MVALPVVSHVYAPVIRPAVSAGKKYALRLCQRQLFQEILKSGLERGIRIVDHVRLSCYRELQMFGQKFRKLVLALDKILVLEGDDQAPFVLIAAVEQIDTECFLTEKIDLYGTLLVGHQVGTGEVLG